MEQGTPLEDIVWQSGGSGGGSGDVLEYMMDVCDRPSSAGDKRIMNNKYNGIISYLSSSGPEGVSVS